MSIYIGNNKYKEIYLGSTKISEVYLGSNKIFSGTDPYNPLNLPANTIRVKFKSGYIPSYLVGDTQTLVDSTNNVYDIYKASNDWSSLFNNDSNSKLLEVLGANTTNVTNMNGMFNTCSALTTVPVFDTSNVNNMQQMFFNCSSLTTVPLFDTSSVTSMYYTFYNCTNVQSGALALYQQASSQATPPSHSSAFRNCGSNTTTGAAELAQIPSGWK